MARRLSVLAGSGALVSHVVDAALEAGDAVQIVAFAPQPERAGVGQVGGDLTQPTKAIEAIIAFRSTHVVLAGSLSLSDRQREVVGGFVAGEPTSSQGDAALSAVRTAIERHSGASVVGVQEIAANLLAEAGPIAGPGLSANQLEAARSALTSARDIGRLDLGQAVVVAGRRLIAAEDVGGTDDLLARVAAHRTAGRVGDGAGPLILAKAAKPQQPLYVDLPTIGPATIAAAAAAGINVIVIEAGKSLVLDRPALSEVAMRLGVGVIGLVLDD